MAYTIKHPDGTTLLTLADSKVDEKTTSLTLIGKNVPTYGEYYNNNLIALLQNFASVDEPRSPLLGQMWYDVASGRVKIYDLNDTFRPITGILVGESQPVELAEADFWYDTINEQLFFSIDGQATQLIGPDYPVSLGNMGWKYDILKDTDDTFHSVGMLYNNNQLIGIVSEDDFDLSVAQGGITTVKPGININTGIAGVRFAGTATSADAIQGITIGELLKNNVNEATSGSFSILNNLGLAVGTNQNITLYVDSATNRGVLQHNVADVDFRIRITDSIVGLKTALYFDSTNSRLGIWNENPSYPVDIIGNTRIQGDLIVLGGTTNITSTALQVNDKSLELGYGLTLDFDANDGGIILHGTTDHTVLWKNNGTGWNSNDNFNLTTSTFSYQISGTNVISYTSLGNTIISAPSLSTVGTLNYLKVDNVYINGNTVSSTGTNETLYLSAIGTGTVSASSYRITDLSSPSNNTDAANKQYVDDQIQQRVNGPMVISMDVTNFAAPVEDSILTYLDLLLPIQNPPGDEVYNLSTGTRIRVLCSEYSINKPSTLLNLNVATTTVDKGGVQNSQSVLTAIAGTSTQQTLVPSITYTIREYRVSSGLVWLYNGIIT
jgi:hypothetical protein